MEKLRDITGHAGNIFSAEVLKNVAKQLLCLIFSFAAGGISLPGDISPFALSFVGGTGSGYLVISAVGAAAGYLFFCGTFDALGLICAVTMICFIRMGSERIKKDGSNVYFLTAVTFLSSLMSSVVLNIAIGFDFYEFLLCICESVMAGAGTCFVYRVFNMKFRNGKLCALGAFDNIAIMMMGATLLLALDRFTVGGFSAAYFFAEFAVMLYALFGRETSSALAGICCAVTLGFSKAQPQLMLSFPLAGLLCGIGSAYGKIPVAVCCIIADTLAVILRGTPETALYSVAQTVVCALIFVFLPEKLLFALSEKIMPLRGDPAEEDTKRLFRFTLKKSAKAVADISDSVMAVSKILSRIETPETSEMTAVVRKDVCEKCRKKDFCLNRSKKATETAFNEVLSTLEKNKKLSPDMLPEVLGNTCVAAEELCDAFNRAFCEYNARLVALSDVREAKELAATQFASISVILGDVAENTLNVGESDARTAAAARNILEEFDFCCSGALAFRDVSGRSTLEVFCTYVPVIEDYGDILARLFDVTGFLYREPVADEYSEYGTVLSFCEQTRYAADVAVSSKTSDGERFCGDAYDHFYDGKGNFYVILSDGMGTGGRAAVDSVMTCSLMSRLMKTGFSVDSAIKAVNSALIVKSSSESLSTLDILKINMESGKTEFYKAGAAMSVLRRGDKTAVVERSSLPLGIMGNISTESASITLSGGDTIIIMSDGAAVLPPQYFKDLLYKGKNASAKLITEKIVKDAAGFSPSSKHDDITAVCVRIS